MTEWEETKAVRQWLKTKQAVLAATEAHNRSIRDLVCEWGFPEGQVWADWRLAQAEVNLERKQDWQEALDDLYKEVKERFAGDKWQ